MIQINLLPWREQARQVKKLNFAISIAGCALAAFFFLLICHVYYKSLVNNQLQRNNFLQAELAKEQNELNNLTQKKERQISDIADLRFMFSLQQSGYLTVGFLNALAKVVPETVTLNRINREGNTVIILGKAKSNLQVTTLLKNIQAIPIFQHPELTEISGKDAAQGEERVFQLKMEIVQSDGSVK